MAKIEFLSPRWSDRATVAASSQQSTLPASNLQDPQPRRVWRSAGLSNVYITWQMESAIAADMLAAVRPNFTANALWRLRGGMSAFAAEFDPSFDSGWVSPWPVTGKPDDPSIVQHVCILRFAITGGGDYEHEVDVGGGTELMTVEVDHVVEDHIVDVGAGDEVHDVDVGAGAEAMSVEADGVDETHIISLPSTLTDWRLDIYDPTNPDGYVEMGVALLGPKIQTTYNFSYGGGFGDQPNDVVLNSTYGITQVEDRDAQRFFSLPWKVLPEEDVLGGLGAMLRERKTSRPFLICADPDATTYAHVMTQYGRRDGPMNNEWSFHDYLSTRFKHLEWI